MIRFYIVRHGQTLFNKKDLVQGWCDSPLTTLGQKQARQVGINLKDVDFVCGYSSISERAFDTAKAILGDTSIRMDKRLKEFNFGELEGEKNSTLLKGRTTDFNEVMKIGWVDVGGENEQMVRERLRHFFDDITSHHQEGNILITSHGMTIMAIIRELISEKSLASGVENCSVSIIEYEDQHYVLKELNNTRYRDQ